MGTWGEESDARWNEWATRDFEAWTGPGGKQKGWTGGKTAGGGCLLPIVGLAVIGYLTARRGLW